MKDKNILLRKLKNDEKDYKMLEKWYQNEIVYKHFEQRKLNYEEIKQKYYPRTQKNSKIPVYIIEYNTKPIGIIQYQAVDEENKKLYRLNEDNIYEVDIFIGETKFHNLGIGEKSINIILTHLFNDKNATEVVMCPLSDNYNAIKCYKKCGFKEKRDFITENTIGDLKEYTLMIKYNE